MKIYYKNALKRVEQLMDAKSNSKEFEDKYFNFYFDN